MIEKCNFKSKIRHRDSPGCRLTPPDVVCPDEEDGVLYQIYQNTRRKSEHFSLEWFDIWDMEKIKKERCLNKDC